MIIPRNPFPPTDGALLVINDRIKLLKSLGHEVVCFIIKGSCTDISSNTFKDVMVDEIIFSKWRPTKNQVVVIWNCLFLRIPPLVSYYYSLSVLKELEELIKINDFKYVTIDHLHLSYYGKILQKKFPFMSYVLFHHNIESDLYYSLMKKTKLFLKPYFFINSKATKYYENKIYKFYNKNIFISKSDLMRAEKQSAPNFDGSYITCTTNTNKYFPKTDKAFKSPISIGFIGSMDYRPNIEGVEWFIKNVIPLLALSDLKYNFYIIGKNPPKSLYNMATNIDNIKITGWVDDDVFYYHKMDLIVCPIFSGAGVKIKVLNALSCGKVIIASSKAVEGIEGILTDTHFLKADLPNQYSEFILDFGKFNYLGKYESISKKARQFILDSSKESFFSLKNIFK